MQKIMLMIVAVIAVVILYFVLLPLAAIWSVNTLFETTIPYTLKTYLASMCLCGVVGGSTYNNSK